MVTLLAISIAMLSVCTPVCALSPPQYGVWRQLNASIGAGLLVQVEQMQEIDEGNYVIPVRGRSSEVSAALAAILITAYSIGGINVQVQVLDPDGSPVENPLASKRAADASQLQRYFERALCANPYIHCIRHGRGGVFDPAFWVECNPKIIQFWNDNIGDYYGNEVFVAADVFKNVLQTSFETEAGSISVGFTTKPVWYWN